MSTTGGNGTREGGPGSTASGAGVPQLPLALRYPPDQRLEAFVRAPAGVLEQLRQHALGADTDMGTGAGTGVAPDALYIAGPPGVGKTHLLLATCAAADRAGRRAAYLPLRAAAGRLRDALRSLEGNDVIAFDGLEAIAGDREDEVALFDAHNRARAAGVALIYAAREIPDALGLVLPDLRSRLGQCTRITLTALDDQGRREVLLERAKRRGLVIEDAAIDWLLRREGRDLAGLTAVLDRLDRASLAAQRRITVPFLRQILAG